MSLPFAPVQAINGMLHLTPYDQSHALTGEQMAQALDNIPKAGTETEHPWLHLTTLSTATADVPYNVTPYAELMGEINHSVNTHAGRPA